MKLLNQLKKYQPYNEQESKDLETMIQFIQAQDDAFLRSNTVAHFTASAWIVNVDRTKVLMVYHNLYDSWSWTGGHADGDTNLLEVAIKEAMEETGVQTIHSLSEEIFSIEIATVDGHIKHGNYVSSHLHLNVTYLLEANEDEKIIHKPDENSGVSWFELDEAVHASSEPWFRSWIYKKLNEKLEMFMQ